MDIHRCRFVPFPTSSINAIAFSHPTPSRHTRGIARLALGRANGDVEIWNPSSGNWLQETIIHGGSGRSVDSLVWVVDPDDQLDDGSVIPGRTRLFSIGYSNSVTEWDLEKGKAKRHASGQHGDLWCLGIQPAAAAGPQGQTNGALTETTQGRRLVAGTGDGSLVIYSIDDDDLNFQRILVKTAKKKVKMVSLAFQSRQVVVVGCSDSSIRVYNLKRGTLLRQMTLGSDLAGGAKDIIVWAVKCLPNGDIISGDSTGQVCIWDGKTYTQAQRIESHKADVLSLATSSDGKTIISGGMDRRTAIYKQTAGNSGRWAKSWHRRYHQHDVKAMASLEHQGMSVVVSGGPDATPVVVPLQRAGAENHRTLSHLPQALPMESAPRARVFISWWGQEISIWRLSKPMSELVDQEDEQGGNHELLGRILIKGEANITSASISSDGSVLFVATNAAIKAFGLLIPGIDSTETMRIKTIEPPESFGASGATMVKVSPDGSWLGLVKDGSGIHLHRIVKDLSDSSSFSLHSRGTELRRLAREMTKSVKFGGLGSYVRTIRHVAFSADGKMLAAVDLSGAIDTWILQEPQAQLGESAHRVDDDASVTTSENDSSDSEDEDEDSNTVTDDLKWVRNPKGSLIPKLSAAPITVLSFSDDIPSTEGPSDYTLLVINSQSRVYTFHPLQGSMTEWSRRNPASRLPDAIRATRDVAKGVLWQGSRIWVYGVSFLFMLDLAQDYGQAQEEEHGHGVTRKRKRARDTGAGSKMEIGRSGPERIRLTQDGEFAIGDWKDVDMTDAQDTRDSNAETASSTNDETSDDDDEDDEGAHTNGRDSKDAARRQLLTQREDSDVAPKWWHTYKYRPILGIVPMGKVPAPTSVERSESDVDEPAAWPQLDVALVERPLWDVDLPPRYVED